MGPGVWEPQSVGPTDLTGAAMSLWPPVLFWGVVGGQLFAEMLGWREARAVLPFLPSSTP